MNQQITDGWYEDSGGFKFLCRDGEYEEIVARDAHVVIKGVEGGFDITISKVASDGAVHDLHLKLGLERDE
jgi:hypothetical protein